jgi:hypothetical protein
LLGLAELLIEVLAAVNVVADEVCIVAVVAGEVCGTRVEEVEIEDDDDEEVDVVVIFDVVVVAKVIAVVLVGTEHWFTPELQTHGAGQFAPTQPFRKSLLRCKWTYQYKCNYVEYQ